MRKVIRELRFLMAHASEESVAAYLRIPRSAHGLLKETAEHLGLPLSQVTFAIFNFLLSPAAIRGNWPNLVAHMRELFGEMNQVFLQDFEQSEWDARRETYEKMQEMGLVQEFTSRVMNSGRIGCTFKVSDSGRVISHILGVIGMTKAPDECELLESEDLRSA
jgi:hypothetical protein